MVLYLSSTILKTKMRFSKKKQNKKQELEKISVPRMHTRGDCELRSLLIVFGLLLPPVGEILSRRMKRKKEGEEDTQLLSSSN